MDGRPISRIAGSGASFGLTAITAYFRPASEQLRPDKLDSVRSETLTSGVAFHFLRTRSAVHLAACATLLGWRALILRGGIWHDWVAVVALYWAYTSVSSKSPAWPTVTTAVMGGLLGLYAAGQLPRLLGWAG